MLHNHPSDLLSKKSGITFSGSDIYNLVTLPEQELTIATTEDGVWIATRHKQSKYIDEFIVYTEDNATRLMYKMENKDRQIQKDLYENKYKELYDNSKTREERNTHYDNFKKEWYAQYNQWVLDTFGTGKHRDIEINFYSIEELKNVR